MTSAQSQANADSTPFAVLMEQLRAGSEEAAWKLLETYGPHIKAVVRRFLDQRMRTMYDSDDFVQSVWASLICREGAFENVSNPKHFVMAVARNKILDELRKRKQTIKHDIRRVVSLDDVSDAELASADPRPSEWAVERERWQAIMKDESEISRNVVRLRIAGYTYVDIAEQLNISERTARRTIRRLLEKHYAGDS